MWGESRWWRRSYGVSHEGVREGGHAAWKVWCRSCDVSHVVWNASHDVSHAALICDLGHMMQVTRVGEGVSWQSDRIVFTHLYRAYEEEGTDTKRDGTGAAWKRTHECTRSQKEERGGLRTRGRIIWQIQENMIGGDLGAPRLDK